MRNNIIAILLLCVFSTAVLAAPSVKNYFSQPTSGNDNTLVISGTSTISGTQTVSGTLNVTGYASINGYITSSALTSSLNSYVLVSATGNYDTAYTDRLKWDGGATGLTAATGRSSLGLGTAALANTANISLGTVTLTGLIANVTTSDATVSTGSVNIPVTVNGVLLYIKANTAQ